MAAEDREDYLADARSAAIALLRYLDTPTPGLWRDKLTPEGQFIDEPAPASSLYHLVAAIQELQRARP
jgi:mannose-6-phosphate isomerase